MKKIATIAAIAAFATLAACSDKGTETVTVPADEAAAATDAATDTPANVRDELKVDKRKNPNEQIP